MPSPKNRFVIWPIMVGGIAIVAASPWPKSLNLAVHADKQGQVKTVRKTTEPPVPAQGKLGQDLFLAIIHRDGAGVDALLKRGADPNARNGLLFTPLDIAAASHQQEIMGALLAAGADPDADSPYGTPLTFAASTGNTPGANLLLARNVNVNDCRGDGMTVLMTAANSGALELVGELLKRKTDVNAKDKDGATALDYAAHGGFTRVGRMLVDGGAAVNGIDANRQTPLMAAAVAGRTDFVRMLLEKGANPNARDAKGRTPLILAAAYGDYPEVIHALVDGGADPKALDAKGHTAAALAAAREHTDSVAILASTATTTTSVSGRIRSPREAIGFSLKLLQASTQRFEEKASCVSCHHEGLGRIATGAARDHGFPLDSATQQAQTQRVNEMLFALRPLHEKALTDVEAMKQVPLIEIDEVSTADCWVLAGMSAQHQKPNEATAAMAMVLARQQSPDGHWSFVVPRVPMQSSFFTFTALAVRAMSTYGPKSHAVEIAERTGRAKAWLLGATAHNSEDRASCLLGLKWTGASDQERQTAVAAVLADQRPDGGWAQLTNLQSDAYATGQALYALHVAGGLPVTDPVYDRGVKFLLRTQDDDGSWFVSKRAMPNNNHFDTGFPNGKSQFSSFNGTCWATLALLQTIDRTLLQASKR